jgi:hypothetical protein
MIINMESTQTTATTIMMTIIIRITKIQIFDLNFWPSTATTGTNQGADGRSLCRRQNVGAVGIAGGWGRRRRGPSAQISRRHSRICADGHRRPRGHPRHKRTGAVGTPSPSAQDNDRWAQKLRPLTETSSADGQAVGSDVWAMPTAKPSAQLIFFLNLFIVLKNLNLFIYVLLSSIYTCEGNIWYA